MIKSLPESQVTRLIQADKRQFALFLGAGASVSSGVPSAGAMIREWRALAHRDARSPQGLDDWCLAQPWFGTDHEYSALFEQQYPNPQARQTYIERKIERAFPGWGYLYLANLIATDWFNVVLTTNFDDLLAKALSIYTDYVPVVCAADSEVLGISLTSRRAKIIKLHGDYLFRRLKNTVAELRQLDPNMQTKFDQVAQHLGLLVLGYGGRDHSVMSLLKSSLERADAFGPGVYWGLWRDEPVAALVDELAQSHPDRFHLFRYHDSDAFLAGLHAECGAVLPAAVVDPFGALRSKLATLVGEGGVVAEGTTTIRADRVKLQEQLDLPWAKRDSAELLQAQLALARRDTGTALNKARDYAARHPDDAQGLVLLSSALLQRLEDGGALEDGAEAARHLREAIRLDGDNLAARYGLVMSCFRLGLDAETVEATIEVLDRVPGDKYLRATLAQLYLKTGRVAEACTCIQQGLQRDPSEANLHMLWSQLMTRNGNTTEALKATDEAVRLDPRNAAFHSMRGSILAMMTRSHEAIGAFEEAIRLDPEDHFTRLSLVRCHMILGATEAGIAQARLALRSNPDSVEAGGLLGQLHMQRGEFPQALAELDRLVRLTPNDPRCWATRGQLHFQMGQLTAAEADLNAARRLNPQDPGALTALAWLYHASRRPDRVQAVLDELQRAAPQAAQMLRMQMSAAGPMPALPGAASGLVQRFIDAIR